MIEVTMFKPEHLDMIEAKDVLQQELDVTGKLSVLNHLDSGYSQTFMAGQDVVAIFGGILIWEGLFDVFAIISDKARYYPVEFHKKVKRMIDVYADVLKVRRMQFYVQSDYTEGQKWAKSLGFHKESTMEAFGPTGKDCDLYVRLTWP